MSYTFFRTLFCLEIIAIMHNYTNQHANHVMPTRHSCGDWMALHSFNCEYLDILPGRGRHLFNVRTLIKERTLIQGRRTLI